MELLLNSSRLSIRKLALADASGLFEMDSDPEVHRYLGTLPLTQLSEAEAVIRLIQQQYKDYGIGRWAVVDRTTDEFLGWTGFKWITGPVNDHTDFYDFGYRFKRNKWGKGYALEAGKLALNYGVKQLGLRPVFGMTHVENNASRKILEKLGFTFVELFQDEYSQKLPVPVPDVTWYRL